MDQETENITEKSNSDQNTEADEKSSRYKEGQVLKFIRVRFPGNARSFPFYVGKRKFQYGQRVVALSDRGMAVGYVNSFPYDVEYSEKIEPVRTISKVATDEDVFQQQEMMDKEREVEDICKDLVKKNELNMEITHVEFTQYGKKCVFYFVAPERVDFRQLVKDLVSKLKMRIELRQISLRDRAAGLGGIGPCGLELCCSSFLSRFGSVNIKMAKNQGLTLISSRLNGLCGQLKCCLSYEDQVYSEKRKHLPLEGHIVKAQNGDIGKIQRLHVLAEYFDMITTQGKIRRYTLDQFMTDWEPEKDFKFPETFQHVVNETNTLIGKKEEVIEHSESWDFHHDDEDDLDEDLFDDDASVSKLKEAEIETKRELSSNDRGARRSDGGANTEERKAKGNGRNNNNRRRNNNNRRRNNNNNKNKNHGGNRGNFKGKRGPKKDS